MKLSQRLCTIALFCGGSALAAMYAPAQLQSPGQLPVQAQNQLCRLGVLNPFVGAWNSSLAITDIGDSASLIVLNQGGTLVETDAIDLIDPNTAHTPGYGAWKALDCQHYEVTIEKILYNIAKKQFQSTTLRGSAILSDDGNSWTATLEQKFFDPAGNVVFTDTVTAKATRIKAGAQ